MKGFFLIALSLQAAVLLVDEFYFHWKRNLPRWERWGHPVDTAFFLLPLAILSFFSPQEGASKIYLILSIASCLVITKDEWIHREQASAGEQWLHSLLFILHPIVLFSGYFLWQESRMNFQWVFFGVLIFWLYQIIFWNIYADRVFNQRFSSYQQ